mgnify:CR=1 FL=1
MRRSVDDDESEQLGAIKKILSQISTKGETADPKAILSLLSRFKNGGSGAAARFWRTWSMTPPRRSV